MDAEGGAGSLGAASSSNYSATNLLATHPRFVLAIGTLYALVFALGLLGNLLVVYVVVRNRHMHTVTNLFIANLALSDILVCVLAVPFTPLYPIQGRWTLGDTMCYAVPFAQGISIYVSMLTLTSIAVERYVVLHWPFDKRIEVRGCKLVILFIWLLATLLVSPYGLYIKPVPVDHVLMYCEEDWSEESYRRLFGIATVVLQFVLPFFVILFCYLKVIKKLRDRVKPGNSTSRSEDDRSRSAKINRMIISILIVFLIAWMPLNIINLLHDLFPEEATDSRRDHQDNSEHVGFLLAHVLAMSSTCYNPFIYAWLNDNFKKEFKQVMPCLKALDRDNESGSGAGAGAGTGIECGYLRSERTCNGNDHTVQESLLPSQQPNYYVSSEMITTDTSVHISEDLDAAPRKQ